VLAAADREDHALLGAGGAGIADEDRLAERHALFLVADDVAAREVEPNHRRARALERAERRAPGAPVGPPVRPRVVDGRELEGERAEGLEGDVRLSRREPRAEGPRRDLRDPPRERVERE